MKLDCMKPSKEWEAPFFKILAKNDTGESKGHQAGVLIPKSLRQYFPQLSGMTSSSQPTIDQRINAELYDGEKFLSAVSTRYQHQSWRDTRSHEARLTDQLGPIHSIAQGGDILVMQRNSLKKNRFKLTLIRKSSSYFELVRHEIGRRRWGAL